ncbi:DNA polymerase iota [Leptinotarsa decemlineata]|uniref:DNA polymerase iota n=1 Tax=Leptinotarsa decemlineata TaxID=7539 RepID=UPI000C252954|nr:DNA polymerase iota [Leptinotarsa decemlineata]
MESDTALDDHSRTIIHVDLDCFYAQVEMNKNPKLRDVPLGIQQKNIVVTSNYIAREYGIKKCMLIEDAFKLCPNLVLVKGEDLHDYRQTSYKVTALLQKYSNLVERLGLDENFIDVSRIVSERLETGANCDAVGNIFGDTSDMCDCGCSERLGIGSIIAQNIREDIKVQLGLTSCAGIGHNKLLSKIAGSRHKPNQQTVVFPNSAVELMLTLDGVSRIPSIGVVLSEQLNSIGIKTVQDLQSTNISKLSGLLGPEKAKQVYDLSFGIDRILVKSSGKPQSIGIEDSCKSISAETEVKEKLVQLLNRLLVLVAEDGRIPRTIKLTVRKFDKSSKLGVRETKQCNINSSLFTCGDVTKLGENALNKVMVIIMRLFSKLVDSTKPYHLTLLGLSFTKFHQRSIGKNALTNFLVKDIEVQSVTNIKCISETDEPSYETPCSSTAESPEKEPGPVRKKSKTSDIVAKRRFVKETEDCESPLKLRVAELRLNSTEKPADSNQNISCPPNADKDVFHALPRDLQEELWEEYKQTRERDIPDKPLGKRVKPNSIRNYLVPR